MTDHVYKTVEITGSSAGGVQTAIDNALAKAGKTLRNIDWFEVTGIRGGLEDGATYYQVTLKSASASRTERAEGPPGGGPSGRLAARASWCSA
jgi:flavin-binding protein dodecin